MIHPRNEKITASIATPKNPKIGAILFSILTAVIILLIKALFIMVMWNACIPNVFPTSKPIDFFIAVGLLLIGNFMKASIVFQKNLEIHVILFSILSTVIFLLIKALFIMIMWNAFILNLFPASKQIDFSIAVGLISIVNLIF